MKLLLLDNIRSMNNVGAIFRSADGAGWDRIILTGYTPTPPRQQISKTALGAEVSVPWEYFEDAKIAIQEYRKRWYMILAAEKNGQSCDTHEWKKEFPDTEDLLLIMGNEVDGVTQELQDMSHHILHLPMRWEKSSLNVAVAAGVFMYIL